MRWVRLRVRLPLNTVRITLMTDTRSEPRRLKRVLPLWARDYLCLRYQIEQAATSAIIQSAERFIYTSQTRQPLL